MRLQIFWLGIRSLCLKNRIPSQLLSFVDIHSNLCTLKRILNILLDFGFVKSQFAFVTPALKDRRDSTAIKRLYNQKRTVTSQPNMDDNC